MATEFKLPELGEGVESGTVAKILVSKGDKIEKEQTVMELETDKAVLELPSEVSGVIKEILVKEGDEIKVGQKILVLESEDGKEAAEAKAEEEEVEEKKAKEKAKAEQEEEKVEEEEKEAEEKAKAKEEEEVEEEKVKAEKEEKTAPPEKKRETEEVAPAAPSTRRFAREIGVDINEVPGSGPGGRISIDDVKAYAKQLNQQKAAPQRVLSGVEPEPLPDFSKWGEVERKPMSNVRKKTAAHLGYAWATIPHVTQFGKADMTELEELRRRYAEKAEKAGGKLTITAILLKIVAAAMKVFPEFNASIDMEKNEIIYKKYYHIGVAVDTDRGLLVPVIRDVNQKSIIELSVELSEAAEKARNKKLSMEDMQGGNFSISNLGGIGGTAFTPVVNSPEVAILGVSRASREQVYVNDQFEPRMMLPLTLSYDHRLIDGADAARFLRWIAEAIEEPFMIVLEG